LLLSLQKRLSERATTSSISKTKITIIFSPKRERKKERRKKDMPFIQPVKRRLSRFFGKILPEAERRCGDFGENPEGLTLY
jgi:hypothetical protein